MSDGTLSIPRPTTSPNYGTQPLPSVPLQVTADVNRASPGPNGVSEAFAALTTALGVATPAFVQHQQQQDAAAGLIAGESGDVDPKMMKRRNYAQEQLDKGVVLEHIAFPVILITGPLLCWLAGWTLVEAKWLLVKICIVAFIFIPMEICDYWLSHLGGNKAMLRRKGLMEKYEQSMRRHWLFLKISPPLIVTFMPLVIFLAVVKPF